MIKAFNKTVSVGLNVHSLIASWREQNIKVMCNRRCNTNNNTNGTD